MADAFNRNLWFWPLGPWSGLFRRPSAKQHRAALVAANRPPRRSRRAIGTAGSAFSFAGGATEVINRLSRPWWAYHQRSYSVVLGTCEIVSYGTEPAVFYVRSASVWFDPTRPTCHKPSLTGRRWPPAAARARSTCARSTRSAARAPGTACVSARQPRSARRPAAEPVLQPVGSLRPGVVHPARFIGPCPACRCMCHGGRHTPGRCLLRRS